MSDLERAIHMVRDGGKCGNLPCYGCVFLADMANECVASSHTETLAWASKYVEEYKLEALEYLI